jgi:hypothetical protein
MLETARVWTNESCAPLWWDEPDREDERERRKVATVCLVNTGTRFLGITAQHVHRQLADRLAAASTHWCQLGGVTFDPIRCLIDQDRTLDLATYGLSEVVLAATGRRPWHAPIWPPPDVVAGAPCALGGHPFQLARDIGVVAGSLSPPVRREFKFLNFHVFRVADTTPRKVVCEVDPDDSPAWTDERFPSGTLLDGMSGGPLIQFPEASGITSFSLRAIIVARYLGLIECRPLRFVRADGTIDRALWDAAS